MTSSTSCSGRSSPPQLEWRTVASGLVTPEQLTFCVERVSGILLVIGLLQGLNIVLMPVLGRLFSLNRRLPAHQRDRGPVRYP